MTNFFAKGLCTPRVKIQIEISQIFHLQDLHSALRAAHTSGVATFTEYIGSIVL